MSITSSNLRHLMIVHFLYGIFYEQINQKFPNWFVANYVVGVEDTKEQQRYYPEISVVEIECLFNLDRHNTIPGQRPLRIAVEVVKPGRRNAQRDYTLKKSAYEILEIPEYWIVDPQKDLITIHQLINGYYRPRTFQDNKKIISPSLPHLSITAAQLLSASLG